MKEFVEKLIGRLEEQTYDMEICEEQFDMNSPYFMDVEYKMVKIDDIKDTVNQLAEEYKDKVIIDGQYCWQTCGANEHCKECNRLSNGSIDYYENYDCLAEEYNNEVCEWKITFNKDIHREYKPLCSEDGFIDITGYFDYKYCPYCGKKIKVVE